jgi:hypothetical protein
MDARPFMEHDVENHQTEIPHVPGSSQREIPQHLSIFRNALHNSTTTKRRLSGNSEWPGVFGLGPFTGMLVGTPPTTCPWARLSEMLRNCEPGNKAESSGEIVGVEGVQIQVHHV